MFIRSLLSVLVLVSAAACVAAEIEDPSLRDAKIRPEAIRAHQRFLSDDLLEGRGSGTRGHELASKYVAAQMQSFGLEPIGDQGTWFQQVRLREAAVEGNFSVQVSRNGSILQLEPETEILVGASCGETGSVINAPLVFAGRGITAPERNHDDYAGIDVKGKIAILLSGAPEDFPSAIRAHYSASYLKYRNAIDHGALAVITLRTPQDEKIFSWKALSRNMALPRLCGIGPDDKLIESIPMSIVLNQSGGERLFDGSQRSYEQLLEDAKSGKLRSFALPGSMTIRRSSTHREITSPNVAGVLRGSDPTLRNEYVLYTAHLDHLGIGRAVDGDNIYNGAFDNASGVAALLEVARTFADLDPAPGRSILFLFVTAEEKGLVGSNYFAHYPTVPIGSIVANLNLDGMGAFYPVRDLIAMGEEHSSLREQVRRAANHVGLEVSPDPYPEQTFFVRSDQYSFVKKGIPALFIDAGMKSADSKVNGKAVFDEWIKSIYHTPNDEFSQPFDFDSAARLAQVQMIIGWLVANDSKRPSWNAGDFFGRKFGAQ